MISSPTASDRTLERTMPLAFMEAWNLEGGPKYPHEKVIQFCFRNFRPDVRPQTRALDLGCGSGVHTVFLACEGFQTTAIDISPRGIANTHRKLKAAGLQADVHCMDLADIGFPSGHFDLVISVGVLDYAGFTAARQGLERLVSQMTPGARGLFLLASERDFRVQGETRQIPFSFTRTEVEAMFDVGFSQVWLDRYITTYQSGKIEQNDWLVTVEAR